MANPNPNHFMNLNGKWWELYDFKGNLIKLCLTSEYELLSAVEFFTEYLNGLSIEKPVIREYNEIFLQG